MIDSDGLSVKYAHLRPGQKKSRNSIENTGGY